MAIILWKFLIFSLKVQNVLNGDVRAKILKPPTNNLP